MKLNNIKFGRPWSGWVGLNVIAERLPIPTISYTNVQGTGGGRNWNDRIESVFRKRRTRGFCTCSYARNIGTMGRSRWSTEIGVFR